MTTGEESNPLKYRSVMVHTKQAKCLSTYTKRHTHFEDELCSFFLFSLPESCSMHFSIKICKFIISQKPIFTSISLCHSNSLHSLLFFKPSPSFSASVLWFVCLSFCSVTLSSLPSTIQTPSANERDLSRP